MNGRMWCVPEMISGGQGVRWSGRGVGLVPLPDNLLLPVSVAPAGQTGHKCFQNPKVSQVVHCARYVQRY